jgi:hypothetical protein
MRRPYIARKIFFKDEGADGDLDIEIVRAMSGPVGALSVLTVPGFELGMVTEVDQRVLAGRDDDVDGTAEATVASVRTAARDELLAPKTKTAAPAVASGHMDVHLIDEHPDQYRRSFVFGLWSLVSVERLKTKDYSTTGMTEIRRPCWP